MRQVPSIQYDAKTQSVGSLAKLSSRRALSLIIIVSQLMTIFRIGAPYGVLIKQSSRICWATPTKRRILQQYTSLV